MVLTREEELQLQLAEAQETASTVPVSMDWIILIACLLHSI